MAERWAKITNRLYRQNRVDVLEVRNDWARISKYYNGRVEGLSGNVARWISANHLSKQQPADLAQPKLRPDSRINGIPKVGESGLTEKDVLILNRGATHFLHSGRCKRIEYGDKSVSKPNTYYVNCGGPRNRKSASAPPTSRLLDYLAKGRSGRGDENRTRCGQIIDANIVVRFTHACP